MKKVLVPGICLTILLGSFITRDTPHHVIQVRSIAELHELFQWTTDRLPLISAHRGGPAPGFPENCLATFAHTLDQTHALIEFDVQLSKDDSLVVIHDDQLDRTTTGTGHVKDHTYQEIKQLRLEDQAGQLTPFGMPTLSEVLTWAKGKTVLTLDTKRSVPPVRVVQAIRDADAEAYTIVIVHTADKAALYHQLNPRLMLSVNVYQPTDLERLAQLGVPPNRMLAFVGVSEPDSSLCQQLHEKGIYCILGTMGNLDRKAHTKGDQVYGALIRKGADVLSTDRPTAASQALAPLRSANSSKEKFFKEVAAYGNRRED